MHLGLTGEFAALWESDDSAPDVFAFLQRHPEASATEKLNVLLDDQQRRWRSGRPLSVEDYLARLPDLATDPDLKLQLALGEFQARTSAAAVPAPDPDEFATRFSDLGDTLRCKLKELPSSNQPSAEDPYRTRTCPPEPTAEEQRIGRYRVVRLLGEGAFGRVWLAFDDELKRQVAIKVPQPERFRRPEDAEEYLAEARTVAGLDHPHIVPVYDVGRTANGSIYVVSKFIEGCNLSELIKRDRPPFAVAASLLATLAQGLHHAHQKRLIHRDVKPANILIEDRTGTAYVADFGLAITEEDYLRDNRLAGTPAYMSPEQARGEGHRLDARSDIFSLGVVCYELLTGKLPFRGSTANELQYQAISVDPPPPRELDGSVPAELERICLKALSKRASDRYATAAAMADDLSHWRQDSQPSPTDLQIVPKGLRSFDAADADFFLQLLPGPRDRAGLPESIQFWKTRLEQTDSDRTFNVGLIYGPSGCGKSSLVKAGLLPRLSPRLIALYVEATPDETEARILRGLRKQLPDLPADLGLVETFAYLRRQEKKKVVVVLDQFEQWLHAHRAEPNSELVAALRQCDGGRVQAVVMVRDDFAMAASRFMDSLDVPIVQGHNFATVDLFDADHAQKVLAKFGRAFGKLPAQAGLLSPEQNAFLSTVANGLADDGKVVSVRLALFAEMVKGKPWTPATLSAVGGTEGVGVNFLEETFAARSANPEHRLHQQAARAVLQALLPEVGTDIKGHMRSHAELLDASGYQTAPADFRKLLRILDGELRLITPTDPVGFKTESDGDSGSKFYQLTHDYLVPSLREWLTRKQKETRRGRAELLLADRAAVWITRPENRQLPSLGQWCRIHFLTRRKNWTPPERKMMRQAGRFHARRGLVVGVLVILLGWAGYEINGNVQARALRDRLLVADIGEVPNVVRDMTPYRPWIDPLLHDAYARAEFDQDRRKQLHSGLALLPVDPGPTDYLARRLLTAEPHEVAVIRDALAPQKEALLEKWWAVLESPEKANGSQRLRAAAALAKYDPENPKWAQVQGSVVDELVAVPAVFLASWIDSLRPVRTKLIPQLSAVYREATRRETERSLATDILADYAADQPSVLAELLMDADEKQFAVLFPKLAEHGDRGLTVLQGEVDRQPLPAADEEAKERLAKRQANAAVTLVKLNQSAKVWPLLKHGPDPRVRSYLIHSFAPLGVDPAVLIRRLEVEPEVSSRRALILSLGEFDATQLPGPERQSLLTRLLDLYQHEPDAGLHGAAEWLLRRPGWDQGEKLSELDSRLEVDDKLLLARQAGDQRRWYVNPQGQTFVIVDADRPFPMGSPKDEPGREPGETLHSKRIGRTFALASKEVTKSQFRKFLAANPQAANPEVRTEDVEHYSRTDDSPQVFVDWYDAARYCNWLSKEEGLDEKQWCYEPIAEGMKPAADYLRRSGYRLPTEAEWEFACRSGTVTSRHYGLSVKLLPKYAWFQDNAADRAWPVAGLKPNDFGLFDMLGNVFEWCNERQQDYPVAKDGEISDDSGTTAAVRDDLDRMLRGASFNDPPQFVRSANRGHAPSTLELNFFGLRVARTLPQVPTP